MFDSEKVYDRLLKRGTRPVAPAFGDESETLAYVKDLDGIWVELIGPPAGNLQTQKA